MDELWSAPAKINVTLRVRRPRADGFHPLDSVVQTVDWADELRFRGSDADRLSVDGADLPTDGENLVWKAVDSLSVRGREPLEITLEKRIPAGAGLGGGSSDAACVISALGDRYGLSGEARRSAALRVGADVTFFLTGGTARMEGIGERITPLDALNGFVVAIIVPDCRLSTPAVYRRWDELGHPAGQVVNPLRLPPALRQLDVANDLTPAAIDLEPELGDLIDDLIDRWERPVMMSGSGSSLFGCFADIDEASDAVATASEFGVARACRLAPRGVHRADR